MKPHFDNRTIELQKQYPRTHGDAFAEQSEGVEVQNKYLQEIKPLGSVIIKGAVVASEIVPIVELEKVQSNVVDLAKHRNQSK